MATSREYINFVLEQLSGLEEITYRQMMGEYIIYYRGKIAAYVCDDRLLVKPVETARKMMLDAVYEPPYEGAKEMLLVERIDEREFLEALFRGIYDELPEPKKRSRK